MSNTTNGSWWIVQVQPTKSTAPKILPLRAENDSDLFAVTPYLRAVRLTCKVVLWVGWT